jgi:endonuclease YncB( thermonuclease family)
MKHESRSTSVRAFGRLRAGVCRGLVAVCLGVTLACPAGAQPQSIRSYARVHDDGTLQVGQYLVRLNGIYLPETERTCRTWISPVRCADRAVLALDFRISGFVHCFPLARLRDGTLDATCYVGRTAFDEGEDLSAYLLRKGWALALPDAPFEYHAMEKIARHRGLGVWGIPADRILIR